MSYSLMDFYNASTEEDAAESLRLALMFQEEVEQATQAYMELLQMVTDGGTNAEQITQMVREAINASLLTGIRAYRNWIEEQGVDVKAVEANSGKDIPTDFFHAGAKWPL